mgnify:CR=1 FL=1
MKRLIGAVILLYVFTGYGQAETSKNLLGNPTSTGPVLYNAEANTYQYSYQTGQVTASGPLPQYDPLQILTLIWSFDALYNCNNSIGGYCGDPDGKEDEISAFLEVDNSQGDVDARNVFTLQDYSTEWQTFTGNETYDFSSAYESVNFRIEGKDRGYWAGYYGPKVRNPSVVAIYTPINTGTTIVSACATSQNDLSCDGYGSNTTVEQPVIIYQAPEPQPPTFGDQATNTVFGDSPDDFLFLDQPDATGQPMVIRQVESTQVYQSTPQEEGMMGLPPAQGIPKVKDEPSMQGIPKVKDDPFVRGIPEVKDDPSALKELEQTIKIEQDPVEIQEARQIRAARSEEIMEEAARVIRRSRPEPDLIQPASVAESTEKAKPIAVEKKLVPVEVAAKTRENPVDNVISSVSKPAVDAVGIALSLVNQQPFQGQQSPRGQQTGNTQDQGQSSQWVSSQSSGASYWNPAGQETQVAQVLEQQPLNIATSVDLAPPSQAQFEEDFNDAIATGQSVGQFLSAQQPDFSRFEVAPPSVKEQKVVQRATVSIQTMTQTEIKQSMEAQLENLEDTGGFTDQSLTVFLISNTSALTQYQGINLSDRNQFYKNTQIYSKNSPQADPLGVLRLRGSERFDELVDPQWRR